MVVVERGRRVSCVGKDVMIDRKNDPLLALRIDVVVVVLASSPQLGGMWCVRFMSQVMSDQAGEDREKGGPTTLLHLDPWSSRLPGVDQ